MTAMSESAMTSSERYRDLVRVTSFGELLWDRFPDGERLGGAPANLAFHAARLGAKATLITEIGPDLLGTRAISELEAEGVSVLCARESRIPTGTVTVTFEAGEPCYEIVQPAAWDEISPSAEALRATETADVFCFGTLAVRSSLSRETLETLLLARTPSTGPIRLLDLNLRAPHFSKERVLLCLRSADIIKASEEELEEVGRLLDTASPLETLLARFEPSLVCVTAGRRGATAHSRGGATYQPAFPSSGDHPVGAGDAFAAALAVRFARGASLERCLEEACRYAARVAELPGAMPRV